MQRGRNDKLFCASKVLREYMQNKTGVSYSVAFVQLIYSLFVKYLLSSPLLSSTCLLYCSFFLTSVATFQRSAFFGRSCAPRIDEPCARLVAFIQALDITRNLGTRKWEQLRKNVKDTDTGTLIHVPKFI